MTRRIALSILATVWTLLVCAGLAAYFATRSVLIADLDSSLVARATAQASTAAGLPPALANPDDRWLLQSAGRTLPRPADPTAPAPRLTVLSAQFDTLDSGLRERALVLAPDPATRAAYPALPDKIFWSAPATVLDHVLNRLAATLTLAALLTGLAAAAIAVAVARRSLHPLHTATATLGQIDERHLDRRIDAAALPVELRPVATQLNTMLARLERAFAARKQFLADASHELRTPVAALLTTLEVALRKPRPAHELSATLQNCLTDARLLRRLVDALLAQARADNPPRNDDPEPTDVSALLRECFTLATGLAADRRLALTSAIPDDLYLLTHPHRLRTVLANLLSNAIEYNHPQGAVTLTARLAPAACPAPAPPRPLPGAPEASQGPPPSPPNAPAPSPSPAPDLCPPPSLVIQIANTGPAIPPDALPHIFDPFFRAPSPTANPRSDHDHLGLGLHLVHTHVTALGGAVEVASSPDAGTTFTLTLPAIPAPRKPSPNPLIPISLAPPILTSVGLPTQGPTS